ncbi:MAG: HAD-IB family hydrolase [Chloroflexi bacterium]|nr:HAD-IB family hydrolase [Chloroflexota bacterium]
MAQVLAVFDFDGTLYDGRVWRSVVNYFQERGEKRDFQRRFRRRQIPRWILYRLRLLSQEPFVLKWMEELAGIFAGYTLPEIQEIFGWIVEKDIIPGLRPRVVEKLREHQAAGHTTVLLSGSYEPLLELFNKRLGIDYALGTRLAFADGRATGGITTAVCMGPEKARRLSAFLKEQAPDADLAASYAYIDSTFDLPLAQLVGHPVVVAPEDEKMRQEARAQGWEIID